MTAPKLGYIILYVQDVSGTIHFYKEAFGLEVRFVHESNQYAEMETGQTVLAFAGEDFMKESHSFRPNRASELAPGVEVALVVHHVEHAFQQAIEAGATQEQPPTQKPWGQTVCYVRDNNGLIVELCDAVQA